MSLQKMFDLVLHSSQRLRMEDVNADGLAFWKPIKSILSNYDITASTWKKIKNKYDHVLDAPEYYINGRGEQNIIEVNHFVIQTIRIPKTEDPSLRKIIQIALNIGQYVGSSGYREPWMYLNCYLTVKHISSLSAEIDKTDLLQKLEQILA